MSTALNTDGHDGPPAEAVAVMGTDGLPRGSVPDLTVKTLGRPQDRLGDGAAAGVAADHRALRRRDGPRAARRHPGRRGRPRAPGGPAARAGALRAPPQDLLRPVEDPRRDRHLRRVVSGPQRRDRRAGPQPDLPLQGPPRDRHPERLPGVHPLVRPRRHRAEPRVGAGHLRRRRHRAGHLARSPEPRGDRRLPRAAQHQHAVRHRWRRLDARRDADRAGDHRAGPADRRRRHPQDHRQRHPAHRPELRLPDGLQPGQRRDPGRARGGEVDGERGRARPADGPALRLHRLLRRARPQRRRRGAHPGGALRPRRSARAVGARAPARGRARQRGRGGRRGRRSGSPGRRPRRERRVGQHEAARHRALPAHAADRALRGGGRRDLHPLHRPSYAIRSVPANPYDSVYCVRLSQAAAHAAMSGRTEMVVGRWRRRFVHLPMALAVSRRNQVDPRGDLWMAVLESTGQPVRFT